MYNCAYYFFWNIIKTNMKKLSELIRNVNTEAGVVNEAKVVGSVFEANENGKTVFDNVSRAEKIINAPFVKNPKIDVDANPKMKKLADTFISLVNKKCKWNAYYHPYLKNIDGTESVLVMSGIKRGEGVTITPIGNGNTSVLRYYLNYDMLEDNQVANYTVSSTKMGTVKMFNLLFDIINNPTLYAAGLYENKNNIDYDMINEAVDVQDVKPLYDAIENEEVYKNLKVLVNGGKARNIGAWITYNGFCKFVELINNLQSPSPYMIVRDIINKTSQGMLYRQTLAESDDPARIGNKGACAVVRLAFANKSIGLGVEITPNTDVEVADNSNYIAGNAPLEYRGVDVSFLQSLGIPFEEFKADADQYFDDLDHLKRRITTMVNFCKKTRLEKLANLDVGVTGIFISGIGGIGKSQTWETVKEEMKLVKGKDYAERGNASCAAGEMYKFIYNNNGRVLVFDDTPEMFDGSFKISFWKTALEPKKNRFPQVNAPKGSADENTKSSFYSVQDCEEGGIVNYKKMYFKECPEALNKSIKNANSGHSFGRYNQQQSTSQYDESNIKTKISLLPDTMEVMSRFIFITNASEESLEKELKDHWNAIESRVLFFRMAPPQAVLWARIKKLFVEIKEQNRQNDLIPPQFVDEVIEVIEEEIKNGTAKKLNWRLFKTGALKEDFLYGGDWKKTLISQLRKTKDKRGSY